MKIKTRRTKTSDKKHTYFHMQNNITIKFVIRLLSFI